ncbi:MAG: hypothetical protein V7724_14795 [Sediminicola sp.]
MKRILGPLLVLCLLGCAGSKNSLYNKEEKVVFHMIPAIDTIEDPNSGVRPFGSIILGGLAAIVPNAIDIGIAQIGTALEKESLKYTASYSAKIVGDDFYLGANEKNDVSKVAKNGPGEPTGVLRYGGVHLQRLAAHKKGDSTSSVVELEFAFRKDLGGQLLFLEPIFLRVDRTKAKLRKGDGNVDLMVDLRWNASWLEGSRKFQQKTLAEMSYLFKGVQLKKDYATGDTANNIKDLLASHPDYFPPIPVSLSDGDVPVGYGNFTLEIIVTEVDDYGQRIAEKASGFRDKESDIAKALKSLLDQ